MAIEFHDIKTHCYHTIAITMRVFSAPYTRNRTGRHYNSHRMCVG